MSKRTVIIIVSSIVFAGLVYYAYIKIKKNLTYMDVSPVEEPKDELASMTINTFKLEETDGPNNSWSLSSKKAEMFKKSEKIIFDKVEMIVNGDSVGKTNYKINSNKGAYFIKQDKIILESEVTILTSHGYKIVTDMLEYYTKTKKISASVPVFIEGKAPSGQKLVIQGEGIIGDLGAGAFKVVKKITTKLGPLLEVSSKKAEFNTNSNKVVFEDDLVAKKDSLDITADKLVVKYSSKGEVEDIEAIGDVKIKVDKKYALCEHAVMKGNNSEVVLTGKPEFHIGKDVMVGKKIVFFTDSDEVYVEKVRAEVSEDSVRKKK